jgi:hypothetical protein
MNYLFFKNKFRKQNKILLFLICFLLIIFISNKLFNFYKKNKSNQHIINLTDNWIHKVTIKNDPTAIQKLFCKDGSLLGTVSQTKRTGVKIRQYFEYFAKLKGIHVVKKEYDISKVTSQVYLNTAFITWKWDDIDTPITARMSFLYRDDCIFQLHSSQLPEVNKGLRQIM